MFGQRRQARVVLRWEAVAVQGFGPRVSMTGQHGSAALLHGHTHATTGLDEPADVITYGQDSFIHSFQMITLNDQ